MLTENNTNNTIIESIGVYLPQKILSTLDVIQACRKRILYPLERLTGIEFRHVAGEKEYAIDLAEKAIQKGLNYSRYGPDDIDLLIACNISRYDAPGFTFSFEPSTSVKLRKQFSFRNAICFDISNACAGMFTAVNICDAFLKAGFIRRALVVSGEYITHLTQTAQKEISQYVDPRIPCLTLGDSGVALMLESAKENNQGFRSIEMFTLSRYSDLCIAKPSSKTHGGAIMLTEAAKLHKIAIQNSVIHIVQTLSQIKWLRHMLSHFIMHQTARAAINETVKQLNRLLKVNFFHKKNVINNLLNRGNTASTSHFLAVWDNIHNHKIKNGDTVLFAVQASGITIGTVLYTFDDLPDRIRQNNQMKKKTHRSNSVNKLHLNSLSSKTTHSSICIESIGTARNNQTKQCSAIDLAHSAGRTCLQKSRYHQNDIDLLIHTGVHRDDFICEPAVASLVARKLDINSDPNPQAKNKTFTFDIFNGAIGFLNACYNSVAMIQSNKFKTIMIVASEMENNANDKQYNVLDIDEVGSAMILEEAPQTGEQQGFAAFIFRYFSQYIDSFSSHIGQNKGHSYLHFQRNPRLLDYYLSCILKVVNEFLHREGLSLKQIKTILPPQISSDFIFSLSKRMNTIHEKFVDVVQQGQDLFSSSLAYTMEHVRKHELATSGDLGLMISVGSGIQIGCAIYRF